MIRALFLVVSLYWPIGTLAQNWQQLAKEVGQNEVGRAKAIGALKKLPHLEEQLRAELQGPERFLVYDVISALKIEALKPDLFARIAEDPDGFAVLTLSSMMTSENYTEFLSRYKKYLYAPKYLSAGVIVALLEPFGRLGEELSPLAVSYFLQHTSFEVRMAVVQYVRDYSLKTKSSKYQAFYPLMLQTEPFQVRLAALFFLSELPSSRISESIQILSQSNLCEKEKKLSVLKMCETLVRKIGTKQ